MVPCYGSLETIQLLSETSFSKIKNKKVIWGGTLKWDTLYNSHFRFTSRVIKEKERISCRDLFLNLDRI